MIQNKPIVKVLAYTEANGHKPLITLQLEYWRAIHSELMTHRMFSRNASSSRAVPTTKLLDQVRDNPWGPAYWGANQRGMVAETDMDPRDVDLAQATWIQSAKQASANARLIASRGAHKQIVNRILEPYTSIKVIVTATDWDNFFKLRLAPDAQPEMQDLARAMYKAINEAVPYSRKFHLPYVSQEEYKNHDLKTCFAISAARCARISYTPFDETKANVEKDLQLADQLLKSGHMSPFEHQGWCGKDQYYANLDGWINPRYLLEYGDDHEVVNPFTLKN